MDDGSNDGSPEIAERYREKAPDRVRLLQHPDGLNRGMSASRNLGIRHARGEFLAFLDADDVWLPGKMERQVAALGTNPSGAMVYGPTMRAALDDAFWPYRHPLRSWAVLLLAPSPPDTDSGSPRPHSPPRLACPPKLPRHI